jgi:hypothetical protein
LSHKLFEIQRSKRDVCPRSWQGATRTFMRIGFVVVDPSPYQQAGSFVWRDFFGHGQHQLQLCANQKWDVVGRSLCPGHCPTRTQVNLLCVERRGQFYSSINQSESGDEAVLTSYTVQCHFPADNVDTFKEALTALHEDRRGNLCREPRHHQLQLQLNLLYIHRVR